MPDVASPLTSPLAETRLKTKIGHRPRYFPESVILSKSAMCWRCEAVTEPLLADTTLLSLAQAGDGEAFGKLTDPFRRELQVHCYRMLGSAQDAEDLLQETLLAAWRGIGQFEMRSSLRAWLYRIATNQCLNALRGNKARELAARRGAPVMQGIPGSGGAGMPAALPEPASDDEPTWLEPYPDELLAGLPDPAPGPEARYEARESISLAFITAIQHLSAGQRAALVLRDVLGYRAAEAAEILDCSLDTVNGSLKRARAALAVPLPGGARSQAPLFGSAAEREVIGRFTDAFERGDVATLVSMLTDDAWLTMPPWPLGFRGPAAAAALLTALVFQGGSLRFRLVPVAANRQPVFACYVSDGSGSAASGQGMIAPTLAGDRICGVTRFLDNGLLARFGLAATIPV
jgi:RNA polymerase sigma-70 factor (TIGR02960 family)